MDCKKAGDLIMKYMDGEISEAEAALLNEHIKLCDKCRQEFFVFDDMMKQAQEVSNQVVRAPEGFEKAVMAKIHTSEEKIYVYGKNDKLRMICISMILIVFAVSYFLAKYKDAVIAKLYEYPVFAEYLNEVVPFSQSVHHYESTAVNTVENIFAYADKILSISGIFLLAFVIIGAFVYGVSRVKNNRHR